MVLSLLLSVTAIAFAYWQSVMMNRGVEAQTWQGITHSNDEILYVFVDHPELRPYFYDTKELDENDPNYHAVLAVCELFLDFIDSMHDDYVYKLPGMEDGGKYREIWDLYFRDIFSSSPALRKYAKKKEQWYPKDEFGPYMSSYDNTSNNESP